MVRVFILVPVSAFRGPVQRQQQIAQLAGSNPVLLLARPLMQREQQQSGLNRIQLITGKIQVPALIHQIIDILLNIFDITFLPDGFPQYFHTAQKHTLMIMPAVGWRQLSRCVSIH
ncbi:hypothetical protein D3C73_741210 [compost metagenome]